MASVDVSVCAPEVGPPQEGHVPGDTMVCEYRARESLRACVNLAVRTGDTHIFFHAHEGHLRTHGLSLSLMGRIARAAGYHTRCSATQPEMAVWGWVPLENVDFFRDQDVTLGDPSASRYS